MNAIFLLLLTVVVVASASPVGVPAYNVVIDGFLGQVARDVQLWWRGSSSAVVAVPNDICYNNHLFCMQTVCNQWTLARHALVPSCCSPFAAGTCTDKIIHDPLYAVCISSHGIDHCFVESAVTKAKDELQASIHNLTAEVMSKASSAEVQEMMEQLHTKATSDDVREVLSEVRTKASAQSLDSTHRLVHDLRIHATASTDLLAAKIDSKASQVSVDHQHTALLARIAELEAKTVTWSDLYNLAMTAIYVAPVMAALGIVYAIVKCCSAPRVQPTPPPTTPAPVAPVPVPVESQPPWPADPPAVKKILRPRTTRAVAAGVRVNRQRSS